MIISHITPYFPNKCPHSNKRPPPKLMPTPRPKYPTSTPPPRYTWLPTEQEGYLTSAPSIKQLSVLLSISAPSWCFTAYSRKQGAVHTWCSGADVWVPAQNGVVITPQVPGMWLCTKLLHFALSDAILKHELIAARTKQYTGQNLQKLCAHRDPVPTSVPE